MGVVDKAKDKAQAAKGTVKEKAGKATDDRSLEAKGKGDKASGNLKQAGEKVKDDAVILQLLTFVRQFAIESPAGDFFAACRICRRSLPKGCRLKRGGTALIARAVGDSPIVRTPNRKRAVGKGLAGS